MGRDVEIVLPEVTEPFVETASIFGHFFGWNYEELLLKDNIEILVIMCSYGVENKDIDYIWIEFDMKKEQLIAEVNKKDGTSTEYVLIPSDEIINHIP